MPVESGRLADYEAMPTWLLIVLAAVFFMPCTIYEMGKMGYEARTEALLRWRGDKEA